MAAQFPNVSSRYGAPMGRRDDRGDTDAPYKFRLFRVRLDSGGYDDGGAYWGLGQPLYCADAEPVWDASIEMECDGALQFLRARDREAAKAEILAQYPNATFYR
ncbi:TPA: hypothetical protein ACG4NJ_002217 [Pseudomonas aeruginosa]